MPIKKKIIFGKQKVQNRENHQQKIPEHLPLKKKTILRKKNLQNKSNNFRKENSTNMLQMKKKKNAKRFPMMKIIYEKRKRKENSKKKSFGSQNKRPKYSFLFSKCILSHYWDEKK